MSAPTERQLQLLLIIRDFIATKGYPPTNRELAKELKVQSPTAARDLLDNLERHGFITLIPFISRGIRMTESGHARLKAGV